MGFHFMQRTNQDNAEFMKAPAILVWYKTGPVKTNWFYYHVN